MRDPPAARARTRRPASLPTPPRGARTNPPNRRRPTPRISELRAPRSRHPPYSSPSPPPRPRPHPPPPPRSSPPAPGVSRPLAEPEWTADSRRTQPRAGMQARRVEIRRPESMPVRLVGVAPVHDPLCAQIEGARGPRQTSPCCGVGCTGRGTRLRAPGTSATRRRPRRNANSWSRVSVRPKATSDNTLSSWAKSSVILRVRRPWELIALITKPNDTNETPEGRHNNWARRVSRRREDAVASTRGPPVALRPNLTHSRLGISGKTVWLARGAANADARIRDAERTGCAPFDAGRSLGAGAGHRADDWLWRGGDEHGRAHQRRGELRLQLRGQRPRDVPGRLHVGFERERYDRGRVHDVHVRRRLRLRIRSGARMSQPKLVRVQPAPLVGYDQHRQHVELAYDLGLQRRDQYRQGHELRADRGGHLPELPAEGQGSLPARLLAG